MALLPPPSSSFTYDVFLSFRGMDTRHGFIGNLYKALRDKGIHTFIDDEDLPRGNEITPALVKAIKESKIAIPVFSENYASSSFCLDELVNIIHHVKGTDRLVLPVFYKVDPSHVRHQIGSYGEALAKHEERFTNNMERLQKWKMALHEAANLSGMHFRPEDGYEYKFIEKILEEISNSIRRSPLLHVANHPVGLESRMHKVMSLLDVGSVHEVLVVGIYGLGGIGKTTLARAVYNSIANSFESSCFLHNVRENSTKHGLEHLQEELLSKTIGLNVKLGDVSEGIPKIKERLRHKKVLLILDDVDNEKQLKAMVGEPNWFGVGSRIIITTREKHLLEIHGVMREYKVDELNEEEALELFRWNAFKKNDTMDLSYENILKEAIAYASGLPLALEVIGCLLFGKSIQEWRSAIDRFKKVPSKEIIDKLKISYDALEENQKKIFLDITCHLKGRCLKKIEEILSAHYGVCVKYDIRVLIDKSLIKIHRFDGVKMHDWIEEMGKKIDRVTMHDLIEKMGKEIDRRQSPEEPGKRNRLWFHKDIIQVLEENMGTSEIEMIHLNSWLCEEVKWDGKAFKKMKNLKTLIIKNTEFCKGPQYLPKSLRVLQWKAYPSRTLPFDFHPKNLSICNLSQGFLTSFEMHGSLITSKFMNMRVLKLDYCGGLTRIADVSCFPNLERSSFQQCDNLVTIHNSVGLLLKLKVLNADCCSKIKEFPPLQLSSLEELNLSGCSCLESFPEILVKMENMRVLELDFCGGLTRIADVSCFPNLEKLSIEYCENLVTIHNSVGLLLKLKVLDARGCSEIKKFPPLQLSSLEELNLSRCSCLESFPEVLVKMENMIVLEFDFCGSLTRIPDVSCFPNLEKLSFRHCGNLVTIHNSVGLLLKLKVLNADGCSKIKKFPPLQLPS